jgi:hypothetical protein
MRLMTKYDIAILWAVSIFAALTAVTARLAKDLFAVSTEPPSDAAELFHWERRRRWMIYSEIAALPCFATVSVALTLYCGVPPVVSILIATALGGLGFGFLLNGLQFLVRRKLGMEP